MKNALCFACLFLIACVTVAGKEITVDSIAAKKGPIALSFIGHGTLMIEYAGVVIHIDPVRRYADYSSLPKADLVLVTHEDGDHLDPAAIALITKDGTTVIANEASAKSITQATALKPGESRDLKGITVTAVPAYNTTSDRLRYHPKGRDNGYVLALGEKRVYIAGDTEETPEMKALKDIDVAFLPMNLPYTMTPEQVAAAAKTFRPKILYPYHFGSTDASRLVQLLAGEKDIEVRIRAMQ